MKRWDEGLFLVVGIALVAVGAVQTLLGIVGGQFESAFLTVGGDFLLWRGVILLPAGLFYVYGALNGLGSRQNQALVFMGSIMVWIVAGMGLLATLLEAIPGGEEVWVASATEIAMAMGPPYSPAVLALPFSLVALSYTKSGSRVSRAAGGV
jgi:hypothetical protein